MILRNSNDIKDLVVKCTDHKFRQIHDDLALISHYIRFYGTDNQQYYSIGIDQAAERLGEALKEEVEVRPEANELDEGFRFIDLFAGIGGIRQGFESVGGTSVFSSEWDRFAKRTYAANFGEIPFGDITKVKADEIPDHDILLGGFPCQPFSLAGVSKKNSLGRAHGFLDETQGTLFYDIVRILDEKQPEAFLLENVKNLKSHDKGKTFQTIKDSLDALGYEVKAEIIDARYYVPQHRERIYLVGFKRDTFNTAQPFNFPDHTESRERVLRDILDDEVDEKYTLSPNLWTYLQNYAEKHRLKGNGFGYGMPSFDGVSRTLSARYHKDGSEILINQGEDAVPRRLTTNECRKLMGFPDTYRISDIGVSDTRLYKQFGNSVVVPVIEDLAQRMVDWMNENRLH